MFWNNLSLIFEKFISKESFLSQSLTTDDAGNYICEVHQNNCDNDCFDDNDDDRH